MLAATTFGDRISSVVDGNRERGAAAAAQYGSVAFESLSDALAAGTPDVVVIATPSTQHQSQAIEALASGADVLVEKPHRVPEDDSAILALAVAGSRGRYA